ncbi:MAG: dihydropteroate synthase [Bacteroidia bacterium]
MNKDFDRGHHFSLNLGGRLYHFDEPAVMAILNVTPDSFYRKDEEKGAIPTTSALLKQAAQMLEEGADFLDVGGHSTRPGAVTVTEDEELKRVIPVIEALIREFPSALISIDTYRSKVAEEAIAAGACLINDVTGGREDSEIAAVAARNSVPYVLMHIKGTFQTMQADPQYEDVVMEILRYFATRQDWLRQRGVKDVILDPGFGFGKTTLHNFIILKKLHLFKEFNLPVLAGVSRKSMINKILHTKPEDALAGTIAVNTIALLEGCSILRVHDVKAAKDAIKITRFYDSVI